MVTPKELPAWAKKYLSFDSFAEVDAAVKNAETQTSGEIVPVVVRRSAAKGHVTTYAAFIFLVGVGLLVGAFAGQLHLPWWVGAAVMACAVLPILAPAFFLRLWTADADLDLQVQRRALVAFYELGLTATAGHTGVLIFVSLDEHRVVILADKAIAEKLPPETWQREVATVVGGIKEGNLSRGLCQAIGDCTKLLAPHFPKGLNDRNELKDGLILAD